MTDQASDAQLWVALPIPALRIGPEDLVDDINPAAEGFLNLSARSVAGRPLWDVIAVESRITQAFSHARCSGTPLYINDVGMEIGPRAPVRCTVQIAPLHGTGGQMIVMITPRALSGRDDQSLNVNAAANSAIGMAEMLAHEIKNPLAGIIGAAQLVAMNLPAQDREMTDLIVTEGRRIVKLLEQVEQFGNLTPPEQHPVNLHDVLDRARKSALLGFGAQMRIIQDYDPSLPDAIGDKDQLVQVVLNLIKNAAEAAEGAGGTIRLRSYYEHSFRMRRANGAGRALPLQIEIIDDGPGVPDRIRADVFDPFVSGRPNGTGLGLALTAKIISEHGGWITLTSEPGNTVFRISLPRAAREV